MNTSKEKKQSELPEHPKENVGIHSRFPLDDL